MPIFMQLVAPNQQAFSDVVSRKKVLESIQCSLGIF